MKYRVLRVINILSLIFAAGVFVYQLAFAEERDIKLMTKAGSTASYTGIFIKRSSAMLSAATQKR